MLATRRCLPHSQTSLTCAHIVLAKVSACLRAPIAARRLGNLLASVLAHGNVFNNVVVRGLRSTSAEICGGAGAGAGWRWLPLLGFGHAALGPRHVTLSATWSRCVADLARAPLGFVEAFAMRLSLSKCVRLGHLRPRMPAGAAVRRAAGGHSLQRLGDRPAVGAPLRGAPCGGACRSGGRAAAALRQHCSALRPAYVCHGGGGPAALGARVPLRGLWLRPGALDMSRAVMVGPGSVC